MGGCISGLASCSAYKCLFYVDVLLSLAALTFFIVGVVFLSKEGTQFFSSGIYVGMIVVALASSAVIALGCFGARNPKAHPNYLFCYWCVITILLVGAFVTFKFFKVFVKGIEDTSEGALGTIFNVVEVEVAKSFNDLAMSTYVACCSGCDPEFVLQCAEEISPGDNTDTPFCNNVFPNPNDGSGPETNGDCFFAELCKNIDGKPQGFGDGCFVTNDVIPSVDIGVNTCAALGTFELDGQFLIGPASGFGCGGGSPKQYLANLIAYFENSFLAFAVPWVLMIIVLFFGWFCSLYLILRPSKGGDEAEKKISAHE